MERGDPENKAGYKKIRYACAQAVRHGFHYTWIDTCCIDKSSSAELSEAINSMYSWYRQAEVCYAYLADVPANVDTKTMDSAFAKSRWFTRGWTLQELIGPSSLIFFSNDWIELGLKWDLQDILSKITGIDADILTGMKDIETASVAKRMSWASDRATTRVEDIAYCLMGLFSVNMPMLYGEGDKAFIRLQEEIMKHSDDQSLFAWTDPTAPPYSWHGLLAKSPADFAYSEGVIPYPDWEPRAPFAITNKGLCISLRLAHHKGYTYIAALNCTSRPDYEGFLGIYLRRFPTSDHQYARVDPRSFLRVCSAGSIETVYVRQSILAPEFRGIYPQHTCQLRNGPAQEAGYQLIHVMSPVSNKDAPAPIYPSCAPSWIPPGMPFTFKISKGTSRLAGALFLKADGGEGLIVMLGSKMNFGFAFDVAFTSKTKTFEELARSFRPTPPGTTIVSKTFRLHVDSESMVSLGTMCYMIDIAIEPIYRSQI
ncbi:hypothetical protein W97_08058 [Coniosporium apollinis CBS 100218]|uniref:Uncharacterized protein n=1 Tax=Coniosporium apollinis (strain CBS 100218) TaxID=1168221 RepID=R7Z3M4_CONA1|nr:uncharacterized protein W97_08058 [Coniosporium apollinis CBS 100218]EON68800.1 hypothetical protein W97_08058 [Coniosporium apollinis CBS 100218]